LAGLLLAAGAGRRLGQPKALVDTGSGPWVLTTLSVMAGCDQIIVVVGAQAEQVSELLPASVTGVTNADFATGMASSLRLGIETIQCTDAIAALVMLVDLPDVTRAVLDRLALQLWAAPVVTGVLARAAYQGRPGHPVLIGRDHFAGVIASAVGDDGGRRYLAGHDVRLVECGDIGGARDVDTAFQL